MATKDEVRDAVERLLGGEWRVNLLVHWFAKGEWISKCRMTTQAYTSDRYTGSDTDIPDVCVTCADYVDEFLPEADRRLVPPAFGRHDRRRVDTDG